MNKALTIVIVVAAIGSARVVLAQGGPPGMMGAEVVGAGPPGGPPTFLKELFSPKHVMEHQLDLDLRPEQVDAIKSAMLEAQQKLLELQWKLDKGSESLSNLLVADRVDEAKVLAKLDEVTTIEREVKKANFTLLVRVKNILDREQQEKMRKYRPFGMFRGGGPGGPPPRE